MKKTLSVILAAVLFAALLLPAVSSAESTWYVYTLDGKTLNVRDEPSTGGRVVAKYNYGDPVQVISFMANGWAMVNRNGVVYYVSSRYLVDSKPAPYSGNTAPAPAMSTLEAELASERAVEPFYIIVRPARLTGWVNFRVGPASSTARIDTLNDGKELKVIGETTSWYKAVDAVTNKTGYISKGYVERSARRVTPANDGKTQMGTLNVNGEFTLQCSVPAGYDLQVVNVRGSSVVASVTSGDLMKPRMYMSIAFDEMYSGVGRMNDMTEEELKTLENSFRRMNDVEIEYRQTTYGTKLLVAREVGSDTDFVDIMTVYKGYMIEFNMTPSPQAAEQRLTDSQVAACIQFLSDLDFVPVNK